MKLTRKQKRAMARIVLGGAIFIPVFVLEHIISIPSPLLFVLYFAVFVITGHKVIARAFQGILHGSVFDENFLMAIATVGAFAVGEYGEGAAVMLFYQIGEWFQDCAVEKSRKSIAQLMDIRPDTANLEKDGTVYEVDPEEVLVGDVILVKAGERIPLDGVVIDGYSCADLSALTGEAVPVELAAGDSVISGSVNSGGGMLRVRVTKPYSESTVSRILDLTENAVSKKAKAENFITKFARYYTPAVVIAALLIAVLPPLILGGGFGEWIHRGLIFLVISCPCALVISVPLSFFGGIGGAGRQGILVKGGCYLEVLAKVGTVVFDKTGTLTKGNLTVTEIVPASGTGEELLAIAAAAEAYSDHPVAAAVKRACTAALAEVTDSREIGGKGVISTVGGRRVAVGNIRLMADEGCEVTVEDGHGTALHIAADGEYLGYILVSDEVKEGSAATVSALHGMGIQTVMLTGDRRESAMAVASEVGLGKVMAELLPQDKVSAMEELQSEGVRGKSIAYVGDGINDAPVLALADVGIAMGGIGSDAAIEAADIVLMDDDPEKLVRAIKLAGRTVGIAKQNIIFALGVKLLVLVLGALGIADMWTAVFADVGVSVIAVLNAMRALGTK